MSWAKLCCYPTNACRPLVYMAHAKIIRTVILVLVTKDTLEHIVERVCTLYYCVHINCFIRNSRWIFFF